MTTDLSNGQTSDVLKTQSSTDSLNAGDWTDIVTAIVVAAGFFCGLIWFAFHYSDAASSPILVLAGLLGSSLGWVTGIILSPYNQIERSSFSDVAKLVYGFLSGYVLSKFDPALTDALKLATEKQWVIVCFGLISFLIAVALTYITRRYWAARN